jgi:hypothetical protein
MADEFGDRGAAPASLIEAFSVLAVPLSEILN